MLAIFVALITQAQPAQITISGDQRCISSNGLPNHDTGQFPNQGNPHYISEQNIDYCVDANPKKYDHPTRMNGAVGVAVNGVTIRPGTAEFWDPSSRREISRNRSSGWNYEGMGNATMLGMDSNNAHVDNHGLYHYHGVAKQVLNETTGSLFGYAADGFEIHYLGSNKKASYRLKEGVRPSGDAGPGGTYDGTFVQDWVYDVAVGNLDQCNGGELGNKFVYFVTDSYPFFPRCLWGNISADFTHQPNVNGRRASEHRTTGHRPPKEATLVCARQNEFASCAFTSPRGHNVSGQCLNTPQGVLACVPKRRR